jgi:hypothetical protein
LIDIVFLFNIKIEAFWNYFYILHNIYKWIIYD